MDLFEERRKKERNFLRLLLVIVAIAMGLFLVSKNGWLLFVVVVVGVIRVICHISILMMEMPKTEFLAQRRKLEVESLLCLGAGGWGFLIEAQTNVFSIKASPSLVVLVFGLMSLAGLILFFNPKRLPERFFESK